MDKTEKELLQNKLDEFDKLIDTQFKVLRNMDENDMYSIGLYNGMILMRAVLTGKEPVFYPDILKEVNNNG